MKKTVLLSFLLILLTINACDVDHGLKPLPGRLELIVYFRNEPPKNTQGIYLMISPEFPPHAINEVFHSPNSLPIDQDSVYHEVVLPYGHYDAIALWWYSTETESNLADVLAIPISIEGDLEPLGFDITPDEPVYRVEIWANWNKVNRDASIQGKITFDGEYPENTAVVAVAAFKQKPERSLDYLLYLKSIDFSIDKDENPYYYNLPVRSGSVGYVSVFWLPEKAALTEFQTIGYYVDPDADPQEGEEPPAGNLRPKSGEDVTGIDIHADFNLVVQPEY